MSQLGRVGIAIVLGACVGFAGPAGAGERSFTVANVDYQGTKLLVPATLVVRAGDTVKIKVLNNIPGEPNQHGFSIPDFGIAKVVTRGEPVEVEFRADKPGIFPIHCQLHPAHVAGQLVVLPAEAGQ